MRHAGLAYRALNPVWAGDPRSGEGARRHGGRFNARGTPALYLSLDAMTAVREVSQIGAALQPTLLVTFAVDAGPVFDATDPALLATRGVTPDALAANDWRIAMRDHGIAPTQSLAAALIEQGFAGLRAPSFARGVPPGAANLILWHWGPDLPAQVRLIDDEERLRTASD
ncbi:MAG: RES family NAD+ phosphorylase [Gemmobacter sp.]